MEYKKVLQYTKDLKVLYVEDDEFLREETEEILEDYFDRLDIAIHGLDALEKYTSYQKENGEYYDLVITDINMPFMDGEVLIKELSEINKEQAIIVVSAHSESSRLIGLIQKGITSFLLKPINPIQLIDILYKTSKNIVANKMAIKYQLELQDLNNNLKQEVKKLSKEIITTQRL
jgi:CheY-like chemotaxis protein